MDAVPPSLKAIRPYCVVAKQFFKRDPIVSYFAYLYAVQEGLGVGKTDPPAKAYLNQLMDLIQQMKVQMKGEEALSNDVVAQAHIEEVALKLFDVADKADRNGQFDKNMIKAFYTSSHIFTVLKTFGELDEEIEKKMKYAKWKAVEIDRCLKNGITPTPGPPGGETEQEEFPAPTPSYGFTYPQGPTDPTPQPYNPMPQPYNPTEPARPVPRPRQNPPPSEPLPTPVSVALPAPVSTPSPITPPQATGVTLTPNQIAKAQKFCKFASSSLDYEDTPGAIEFLTKALNLLTTGRDPET